MKLLICSPSSPEFWALAKLTNPNKQEYGQRHQVQIELPSYPEASTDHGWGRLRFMRQYLTETDWLWFMGCDTAIVNMTVDARQFCYEDADMVAAWDTFGFQSDSMFLRNCPKMLEFFYDAISRHEIDSKRNGFLESSDQGCMVRLLTGRDFYFPPDQPHHSFVQPVSEFQAYGLRVKEAPKTINCYLDDFQLKDFVLHAPGMPLHDKIRHMEIILKQVIR